MRSQFRRWGSRRLARLCLALPLTIASFGVFASSALAGNFWATGHDQDFHCSPAGGDPNECAYFQITTSFVRGSSTLPVLILDRDNSTPGAPGSTGLANYPLEAVAALNLAYSNDTSPTPTASSPPYVVEDPQGLQTTIINGTPPPGISTSSVWATTPLVDSGGNPLWSAVIIASDTTCGGCDLNNNDGTHVDSDAINARTSAIQTFFNAGGGLLYLAGANDAFQAGGIPGNDVYYASVPVPVGGQPVSPPFTVTSAGASLGITNPMVNCCATHNSFSLPASGSPVQVAETDSSGLAESLFLQSGAVCSGGFCSALTTGKTADSSTVAPGGTDGYTITITNPNKSAVTLTSITDTLATGFTYQPGTTTGVTTSDPTIASGTATWSGSFTVPAGGSVSLHFNVTAPSTPGGPFTDDAGGTASGGGVTPTGPTAPVTVTGTTLNPLTTGKTADSSTVAPGGTDGYTITITNPNKSAVTLTSITDTLATGFTYQPGTTTGVTTSDPTIASGTATWSGSFTVPAGGSVSLHFKVTAPASAGGPFTDDAGGTASGDAVTSTGPTAPVTVTSGPTGTTEHCRPNLPCKITLTTAVSSLVVVAQPGAAGTLTGSVDQGARLECPGYRPTDPNWFGFLETATNREKLLTYTLKNTTTAGQQFCYGSTAEFKTKDGGHARRHKLPDGSIGFVGLLGLCRVTPHHNPCVISRRRVPDTSSTTGFDTVIRVLIPAGPSDPWGRA